MSPAQFYLRLAFASALVVLSAGKPLTRVVRSDDTQPQESIVMQQAQTISQLQAELTGVKTEISGLEARIANQETRIAFNVRLSRRSSLPFENHEILRLDTVDVNLGNAYDKDNGFFTAPVSGLYLFSLHITHTPPGNLHVQITKNGQEIAEVEASGDDPKYLDRSSNSVVVHLVTGDKVWVSRRDSTSTNIQGGYRTSFTGILVVPDSLQG